MKYVNLYRIIRSNGSVTITPNNVDGTAEWAGIRVIASPGHVLEKDGVVYGSSADDFSAESVENALASWKELPRGHALRR